MLVVESRVLLLASRRSRRFNVTVHVGMTESDITDDIRLLAR